MAQRECDTTDEGRAVAALTYLPVLNRDWRNTVKLASYSGTRETGVRGRTVQGRTVNVPARAIFDLVTL
jgi:hypothetical protein